MTARATSLRVLHVVAPARVGGLESVVVQLAVGQREAGHEAMVATVLQPGDESSHPFLEELAALGVPVHAIVVGARAYLAERREVRALLTSLDIDVMHTHGYRSDILHGSIAREMGRVHVTTLHGFTGGDWRNRAYEWLQVRAAARADAAIAVSTLIAERLRKEGASSTTHVLRNASAPARERLSRAASRSALDLPESAFIVGWVGRLSYEKGPDLFVEALALSGNEVHGVFVGEGPMLEQMRELARERGLVDRLHFAGQRPQASRFLAAFDALALTSRTEGTPMILLEAMWAEVPILATCVGGVPDVVSAEESVQCEANSASSVARAIDIALNAPEVVGAMARNAKERVAQQFGVEPWVEAHLEVYRAACRARHGR